jgi:hypothetical protein
MTLSMVLDAIAQSAGTANWSEEVGGIKQDAPLAARQWVGVRGVITKFESALIAG